MRNLYVGLFLITFTVFGNDTLAQIDSCSAITGMPCDDGNSNTINDIGVEGFYIGNYFELTSGNGNFPANAVGDSGVISQTFIAPLTTKVTEFRWSNVYGGNTESDGTITCNITDVLTGDTIGAAVNNEIFNFETFTKYFYFSDAPIISGREYRVNMTMNYYGALYVYGTISPFPSGQALFDDVALLDGIGNNDLIFQLTFDCGCTGFSTIPNACITPYNESCSGAQHIDMNSTTAFDNTYTGYTPGMPGCFQSTAPRCHDLWYSFDYVDGNVLINNIFDGTLEDCFISIWDSCGGNEIICNTNFGSANFTSSVLLEEGMLTPGTYLIQIGGAPQYLWNYNTLGTSTLSITQFAHVDENTSTINVYPNPAESYLHVQISNPSGQELVVTDVLGKEVMRQSINSSSVTLDTSDLNNGIYLLRMNQSIVRFEVNH